MEIRKRFRRTMSQELDERRRVKPLAIVLVFVAAYAFAQNESVGPASPIYRFVMWSIVFGVGYGLVVLGTAQLRRVSQPFDHTLDIDDDTITITDNLRRTSDLYGWSDFKRVRIDDAAYEFRLSKSKRGESYVIRRERLAPEEDRFLGERFVDL